MSQVEDLDLTIERDVVVKMRDGVRLATDVYRPVIDGDVVVDPLPVLLQRTPYDKIEMGELDGWARSFVRHGYVVVIQDCRGCYGSEGEMNFLFPEADDGYDTVEWLRAQPWCNGRIGTWGVSWMGWTQTAMAAVGTEGIGAMVPNMSGSNGYTSSVRHGGALELRLLAWAFSHSAKNSQAELKKDPCISRFLNHTATPFSGWLQRWPIRRGRTQLALVPSYEKWAFDLLTHTDYDDYWRHPSINPYAHLDTFTDTPTLIVGGWYDSYTRSAFELFEGLSSCKKGPVKIVMGPWLHGQSTLQEPVAGDVWFGEVAAVDFFHMHIRWYDQWLRDVENEVDRDPPVRIFVMGGGNVVRGPKGMLFHGGRWRNENEWPLGRTEFTPYYLHEIGILHGIPPAVTDSSTSFQFDPANPVPSIGGNTSSFTEPVHTADASVTDSPGETDRIIMHAGGFDQREKPNFFGCSAPYVPLAARPDVLVFETEPLETDFEVTGPIDVHLWVSSSAPDTDVTAKLIDVYPSSRDYPEGYALNLTDSIRRLRYRDDSGVAKLLQQGEVVKVTIQLYPTSNLFVAGHRIRLDISSSNFPRFDINPNTGEPLGQERCRRIAVNTIHHDAIRPSHIVLPVIPV